MSFAVILGGTTFIDFSVLMDIISSYVKHPVLLTLIGKACRRTETSGGIFYDFDEKGIPGIPVVANSRRSRLNTLR